MRNIASKSNKLEAKEYGSSSQVKVKCHNSTHSCQITPIRQQYSFSFCTDRQTHTGHTDMHGETSVK